MIDLNVAKQARNMIGWIALSSILSLVLLSFLPMVTVYDADQTESIVYNLALMEKNNGQIGSLSKNLQRITIFFWAVAILSILSFIGIIIHLSKKFLTLGKIFLLIGCGTAIFSILSVIYLLMFIKDVNGLGSISLATMGPLPVKYIYIPLLTGIISLGCSGVYSVFIVISAVKYFKTADLRKKPKEKSKKISKKGENKEEKKAFVAKTASIKSSKKQDEIEDWLKNEIDQVKETKDEIVKPVEEPEKEEVPLDVEPSTEVTVEEPDKEQEHIEIEKEEGKNPFNTPFSKKEPLITDEEKPVGSSDEKSTMSPFESALSSAIEKRQKTKNKTEGKVQETSKPEKVQTKELTVRCPQCKNIFKVKKEGKTTIKCPHCGKEGVAK